ncbi:hypothetical protein L345_16345, partial [Ophiophagus hannah]
MKKTSFLLAEIHDFTSKEAQQLLHNKFVVSRSGNDYHLVRQYRTPHHLVRFYFITRAYSSYMESILNDFREALEADLVPDQPCKVSAQDMIEANFYSANLAQRFWFDVLDLHYYFRFLQDFHSPDGIHWHFRAHRYLTKLLLTHLAEAWQVQLEKQRLLMGKHSEVSKSRESEEREPYLSSADPHPVDQQFS